MTLHDTLPAMGSPRAETGRYGISLKRRNAGRALIGIASVLLIAAIVVQALHTANIVSFGFQTWRPTLYVFLLWSVALGAAQVMIRGERGQKALFLLPALLFTISVVIFPTLFGLYIAFTDWNLSSLTGRHFNGLDNLRTMVADSYFWNALGNMLFYVGSVFVQYSIAFGLALLLNAEIRARKFFRVVFLIPLMLSPVAVSWMVGKSIMEYRYGPLATLMRHFGWDSPAFFSRRPGSRGSASWPWTPGPTSLSSWSCCWPVCRLFRARSSKRPGSTAPGPGSRSGRSLSR